MFSSHDKNPRFSLIFLHLDAEIHWNEIFPWFLPMRFVMTSEIHHFDTEALGHPMFFQPNIRPRLEENGANIASVHCSFARHGHGAVRSPRQKREKNKIYQHVQPSTCVLFVLFRKLEHKTAYGIMHSRNYKIRSGHVKANHLSGANKKKAHPQSLRSAL